MAFTDQEILTEIQGILAEEENAGASWSSGMWEADEVIGHLNDRQQDLVTDTAVVCRRLAGAAALPCVPGVITQALPQGWIATIRLVWVRASDGRRFPLLKSDTWQLDCARQDWRQETGDPTHYVDGDLQTLTVQVVPAPSSAGVLEIIYLGLPTTFDGSGVAATVPDECAPGLAWGTIAHMLTKEGRGKDPSRAAIAGQLYTVTEEAVKTILQGWET